ncbi:hypothetical protein [Herbiconiux daphne]|uniref:Uncharacterized protein n=1 Tax=Herbiconiux daphne TaxID=2970914 RepID=A0ABT2H9C9_9MICO|nr:hypothetical protein [Herbiconiux daphne]MCS5736551.1 hypothetical protein [Herbiconiux daphne]
MGKTFKRNDEDYDEVQLRESRKEAKAGKRKEYELEESTTRGEKR